MSLLCFVDMTQFGAIFRTLLKPLTYSKHPIKISSISFTTSSKFPKKHVLPSNTSITILYNHLKNQRIDEARTLFDKISLPDVYLSTKMISSYVDDYRLDEALKLFNQLPVRDIVMWNLMIKSCVNSGNLEMGLKLFDKMPHKNVISWTTIMNGLLNSGKIEEAQVLFREMPMRDVAAWNAMIHGYFENGKIVEAKRMFETMPDRNVISWTTMISGLDQHGESGEALYIFSKMMKLGLKPSSNTFSCIITACANVCDLCLGRQVHARVLNLGYVNDPYIVASLVTFYANCHQMEDSVKSFDEKSHLNVVVWTSLLTGYGYNQKHESALRVFVEMIRLGGIPNQSSFTSALNSTCEIGAIEFGKSIHSSTLKMGLASDIFVGNSLIVLYTKCGNIKDGIFTFNELSHKNIVSWNAIIVGCAQYGFGDVSISFFSQMTKTGIVPDEITFTGLLNSCSHSCMMQKGRHFFKCLLQYPNVQVKLEHYACMVDILCRSERLTEAEDLVMKMPLEPTLAIWIALLSGCRAQCDIEIAERVAKKIFLIDPYCSAGYTLLSNVYGIAGRWIDVSRIREKMKKIGIVKQPGKSLNY